MNRAKKILCILCILALACSALFAVTACSPRNKKPTSNATVTLSQDKIALNLFEVGTITATTENTDEEVVFSLSADGVVLLSADGNTATLTPVKAGEVTLTAKAENATATATVTVDDDGLRPSVRLTSVPAMLVGGSVFPTSVSVKYKETDVPDAELHYESSNPEVASIDRNGVITAGAFNKDACVAKITVSGTWLGHTIMAETFDVTVTEDVTIDTIGNVTLYTADPNAEGLWFSEAFTVTVYVNGTAVSNPTFTAYSDNESVAKYENGKIVGVGMGDTVVYVKYVSESGGEYRYGISVSVLRPTVTFATVCDLDRSANRQTIDLSQDGAITDGSLADSTVKIDGKAVDGCTFNNKTITFGDLSAYAVGEKVSFAVETNKIIYRGKVNLATAFINNFDSFMLLRSEYWAHRSGADDSKYRDGYFIVISDIDLSETANVYSKSNSSTNDNDITSTTQKGFNVTGNDFYDTRNSWHGVFDGRGHMLYNLHVGPRGIFGAIAQASVVKNCGFEITRTVYDWWAGLAINVGGTVDNVYLEIDSLNNGNGNGTFAKMLKSTGNIKNSVSALHAEDDFISGNHGVLIGELEKGATVLNAYTVAKGAAPVIAADNVGNGNNVYGKFESGAALYTAVSQKTTALTGNSASASFTDFNTAYWTVSQDGVMWKNNESILTAALNTAVSALNDKTYREGDEIAFAYPQSVLYSCALSGDGATYIDQTEFKKGTLKVRGLQASDTQKQVIVTFSSCVSGANATAPVTFNVQYVNSVTFNTVVDVERSPSGQALDLSSDSAITANFTNATTVKIGGVLVNVSVNNKRITFGDLSACSVGENVDIVIDAGTVLYRGKINVVTKIIKTLQDLIAMRNEYQGNAAPGTVTGSLYRDGYYVLDNDIDLHNVGFSLLEETAKSVWDTAGGHWSGVFDGRGHIISNAKIAKSKDDTRYSFFGNVGVNGVVKNLGFAGAAFAGTGWAGVIADNLFGTVDNCFVETVSIPDNRAGAIAQFVQGGTVKNTVAYVKTVDNRNGSSQAALVGRAAANAHIVNAYVIASGSVKAIDQGSDGNNPNINTTGNVFGKFESGKALVNAVKTNTGLEYGAGSAAMATPGTPSFNEFNSGYWTIIDDGVMWKENTNTHKSEFDTEVAQLTLQFNNKTYYEWEEDATFTLPVLCLVEPTGDNAHYVDADKLANGVISVTGFQNTGTATVSLKVSSRVSGITSSATLSVGSKLAKVNFNTVGDLDRSVITEQILDLSDDAAINVFGSSVTVKIGGVKVETEVTGKKLTLKDMSACAVGEEVEISIQTDLKIYVGKVNLATAFISDYDSFMKLRSEYWANRSATDDSKYRDGYFIVTDSIDLSATANIDSRTNNAASDEDQTSDKKGFNITGDHTYSIKNAWHGVLDGRGYMLRNLYVGRRGMFGVIGEHSVVKNIGLDIKRAISGEYFAGLAAILQGTVDNCYIVVDSLENRNDQATFARSLSSTAKISNCISVLTTVDNASKAAHGVIVGEGNADAVLLNVYAVNSGSAPAIKKTSPAADSNVYGKFASISAIVTAVTEKTGLTGNAQLASFDEFNTAYWTITDNDISWKTAVTE